ncbi:hypothetical protein QAD02_013099 [Eretmocerus hayati]|uniref:Uncharacterized protein n=1 Tax=Eretmocerus hayati TaxID=131215 RepID=A0ACC2P1Q6_9HYME|nr:hypothetical protein QAD02_013099 [Eretmocerus hayati]
MWEIDEIDEFDYFDEIEDLLDTDEILMLYRLPKRYVRDFQNPYEWYRPKEFENRYRFSKDVVLHIILPLIRDRLENQNNRGLPVSPELKMTIALRFFATGDFQTVIGDLRGFSQSTVCRVVHKVSVALADLLHEFVRFPETEREDKVNTQLFYNIAYLAGVSALLDATHIETISPGVDIGEIFRNRKGYYSINVLAAVDPRGKFLYFDVRHPGSTHDSTCLDRSALRVLFPQHRVKGLLVADKGFPCETWLLAPYKGRRLTPVQKRHSRSFNKTRNGVETNFGRWKKKFPCLATILLNHIDNTIAIICATAVLWNIYTDSKFPNDDKIENSVIEEESINDVVPAPGMSGLAYRAAYVRRYFA